MSLYAWKNGAYTLYTDSETPTTSDSLYNANGEVITSIGIYPNISIYSLSGSTLTIYYIDGKV